MTLGHYPVMTLEEAKQAHLDNMRVLAQDKDLMTHRKEELEAQVTAANSGFGDVAGEWLKHKLSNKDSMPANSTIASWERDIKLASQAWGNRPISEITPKMVITLCAQLQETRIETGRRVKSTVQRIFTYAIGHGLMDSNPALAITGLLLTAPTRHQPAITSPPQFGKLLRDIDTLHDCNERTALQLLTLLFTRSGDMCAMKWSDIDFNAAQWTLAPQKGQGRSDMVDSLIIPLPRQAIAILRNQQQHTGEYEYVFHSKTRQVAAHMGKQNLSLHLKKLSNGVWAGKHVPHGFRASAITMIQEQLKYPQNLPDMQSGHKVRDGNGTAYNRVKFIDERTIMMQDWADYQDQLKAGTVVIRANFKQKALALG